MDITIKDINKIDVYKIGETGEYVLEFDRDFAVWFDSAEKLHDVVAAINEAIDNCGEMRPEWTRYPEVRPEEGAGA